MALPIINLSLIPVFPAKVTGDGPVTILKSGLEYVVGWDIETFSVNPSPGDSTVVLSHDPDSGETGLISISDIATPAIDARLATTQQAIDGTPGKIIEADKGKASVLANAAQGAFSQDTTYPLSSIGARGKNTVFVTDAPFGAKGDGSTDDTGAFNSAIAFLRGLGGGTLFIPTPANYYKIAGTLTYDCTQPLEIVGLGFPLLKSAGGTGVDMVRLNFGSVTLRQSTILLRSLRLWGDGQANRDGLVAYFLANFVMENVSLYDHGRYGFALRDCYGHRFTRVTSNGNAASGGYLESASGNAATHDDCQYNDNGDYGLQLEKWMGTSVHYAFTMRCIRAEFNNGAELFCKDCTALL